MFPFGSAIESRRLGVRWRGWVRVLCAALFLSVQTPLATWYANAGSVAPLEYGASWRFGVGLALLTAYRLLRTRDSVHPGWGAFVDWRFWLAAVSFADIGLSAWAVSVADPLVYQAVLRLSPVLFGLLLSRQLRRGMPHGAGWFALILSAAGSGLALAGGWQSELMGHPSLAAGLGLANEALMACNGFGYGWGGDLAGARAGVRERAACFCLGAGWGSLVAGVMAFLGAGRMSLPAVVWGLAVGGGQAVCYRLALAGAGDLSLLALMPLGTALGMLWLPLGGLSGAPVGWALCGVTVSLSAVAWSVWLSAGR